MDGTLAIGLNAGLLSVGTVAALLISMGAVVFLSDTKSITHKSFLALTGTSVIWSIFNYAIYKSSDPVIVLWLLRFIMFTATWFAYSFFTFFYVFPSRDQKLPGWYRFLLLPVTASISIVTLTPLVFTEVGSFSATGQVQQVMNGPGIFLFGMLAFALDFGAIFLLVRKTLRARGLAENPYKSILIGTATTILLIVIFSFILPAFFGNSALVAYGTLFLLPFIGFTAYAIDRGHLLNVKELGAAFLVSVLAIATLVEIIFTNDPVLILFRISLFMLILLAGMLLIRGVVREVEQREKIQKLAEDLERSNTQLSEFMSLATHEIRNPATFIKGYAASVLEGDLGKLKPELLDGIQKVYVRANDIIHLGNQYLNKSKLELNQMAMQFVDCDLRKLATELVHEFEPAAAQQGVSLALHLDESASYTVVADTGKLKEVIANLIDNSIKYTPKGGEVTVELLRSDAGVRVVVSDNGVGIPPETIPKLFKKFSRADAEKANILGTGLGLYLAKVFIDAHHGQIEVESAGKGAGSTFMLTLPLTQPEAQPS